MLLSGKRAAYSALFREGLAIVLMPVDYVLSKFIRRTSQSAETPQLPLLLIVGPPRAGTTLIYQYLAATLDVSYPTNLGSLFPRSGLFGSSRSTAFDLSSYFGQTARLGGPNDAFFIWNRWFGDDRYRVKSNLSTDEAATMREFFEQWTAREQRPFLNKNNRNCHCLATLASTLPNAYFVVVNRDPHAIARSLIRARQRVQGSKDIGWGLLSQQDHTEESLGYVRDVCEQVRNVNELLAEQTARIPSQRIIRITYEAFCENPSRLVDMIIEQVDGVHRHKVQDGEIPDALKPSPTRPLSEAEEDAITEFLAA